MSSYDNPRIIEDLYGSMAWAKAAEKISSTLVKGMENITAVRVAGYEKAKKKREVFDLTFNRLSITNHKALAANILDFKTKHKKVDPTFVEQYQKEGELYLNGGMFTDPETGVEEWIMGSIQAETELTTNSNLTAREKEYRNNIIANSTKFQNNLIQFGSNVTPQLELIGPMNIFKKNGYYWEGDGPDGKIITMLSGNFLDNKGIESSDGTAIEAHKWLKSNRKTGENKLLVTHRVHEDDGILGDYFNDTEKYPRDKDGYITLKFEKDINIWDGIMLKPLPTIDIPKFAKEVRVQVDKEISSDLLSKPMRVDGDLGEVHTDTYVNVPKIDLALSMHEPLKDEIEILASMDIADQKAYITDVLRVSDDMPDDFFLLDTDIKAEQYMEWITTYYKRDFGVSMLKGEGDKPPVRDPGNKLLKGVNLIYREITPKDAAVINEGKEEDEKVIAGHSGYFQRTTKQPSPSRATTDTATHLQTQRDALKTGGDTQFQIISKNKKRSIVNEGTKANPKWVQYKWVYTGVSIKDDPDVPELSSARREEWTWQKLGPKEQGYIVPGSDQWRYQNFLQLK